MANKIVLVEPVRLPMTNEAKFLRSLNISPGSNQAQLEFAAAEYNRRFRLVSGSEVKWAEMTYLLQQAWGEIPPPGPSCVLDEKPQFNRRPPMRC